MKKFIEIKLAFDHLTGSISDFWSRLTDKINWLYARIAIITLGVLPVFFMSADELLVVHARTWAEIVFMFVATVVGLQFVIGVQVVNSASAKTWTRPNWRVNPFNFRQPVQFFHFGGWFMVFGSIPYLFFAATGRSEGISLFFITASMGLGALVGTRLSVLLFRRKFISGE